MDLDLNSGRFTKDDETDLYTQDGFNIQENAFCNKENIKQSLSTLSEELECFGITPMTTSIMDLRAKDGLENTLIKIINASWKLIHSQRVLMKKYDELNDLHVKVINDNSNLKNQVKRLKEDTEKKDNSIQRAQEEARRLKVLYETLTRELKREKDEILKLRKQFQAKDNQHQHELRRIAQDAQKLREQLQKSNAPFVPRRKEFKDICDQHTKEVNLYKQRIRHLEENNRLMAEEINGLKGALDLRSTGIDLHIEASGLWTDLEHSTNLQSLT